MTREQQTLRTAIEFEGVGLHSGKTVKVRVLPAAADHGIVFIRSDLPESDPIPALVTYFSEKERRSRLQRGAVFVDTVEHLLAACTGLGVDNLRVEISGEEMPGMDGSAQPFVELFSQSGLVEQRTLAREFKLSKPIFVRHDDAT
ncbi:MAG: UDP-3-O-acyl-N-acetylglucosamine deacetylase, partial [bacterium]